MMNWDRNGTYTDDFKKEAIFCIIPKLHLSSLKSGKTQLKI